MAALNKGKDAAVDSVSCARVDYCMAGGQYADTIYTAQAFVAIQP
jgi:hypothetical protein